MSRKVVAIIPIILIFIIILFFYLSNTYDLFSFEKIQQEHAKWQEFVHWHPLLSAIYFLGIYIVSVILVLPDSTILTLIAGFLFPMPLALCYCSFAETVGATVFFLASRSASQILGSKQIHHLKRMEQKIQNDEAYYLLFLRFSHLVPFWTINLAAGIFSVSLKTFVWTTLIGVLPLNYFLIESGATLSKYFATHTAFTFKDVFTTQLKIALIIFACFALLPIAYKHLKSRIKKK
jgi:uncharacterized membrane protein YdjX (TVP38/TMEM64 family)